jgi:hypothetical protein
LTGKQLARSPPQRVEIKYVDDPAVLPMVLSEVAARDEINNFYFYWNPLFYVLGSFVLAGALWLSTKLPEGGSQRNA